MPTATRFAAQRRGALLLIVLGVLTLFMLAGTVMMTLATRARSSARAFAVATSGTAAGPMRARSQLREALLRLVRGAPKDTEASVDLGESLLGDMYGTEKPLKGRVTAVAEQWPLIQVTLELPAGDAVETEPLKAAHLGGRVLTFDPSPASGDAITSYRILTASGTGPFTCWLTRPDPGMNVPPPSVPCPAVVNQPAFREEAHDAFDDQNRWLTQLTLADGAVTAVPRPAFAAEGDSAEVDNDNDGVPDGVWLRNFLESQPAPEGGKYEFDVSYLVVDLDSRINVNAHGSSVSLEYADSGNWTNSPNVPIGSGYGPADVDASLLFVDPSDTTESPLPSDRWKRILGLGPVGELQAQTSSSEQRRPAAQVGDVQGRYGHSAAAGSPGSDPLSERNETVSGNEFLHRRGEIAFAGSGSTVQITNLPAISDLRAGMWVVSPALPRWYSMVRAVDVRQSSLTLWSAIVRNDLDPSFFANPLQPIVLDFTFVNADRFYDPKGMIKHDVAIPKTSDSPVPNAVYFSPDWMAPGFFDDPYEMRLDEAAARPMALRTAGSATGDNPFTLSELESVLRQFDADAHTLPPRLAVALDNFSQRSRLLLTTDSWDTPALTGDVAREVADYAAGLRCDPLTVMSPDVLAGLRFDVNRPFLDEDTNRNGKLDEEEDTNHNGKLDTLADSKQDFCKHLYMLLVALGLPADKTSAQWAANVVDYRDPDSNFTRFQFDTDPADGWGAGTAGWAPENMVWGIEQPELVIAQTIAFYTLKDQTDPDTVSQDALYVSLYRPSRTEQLVGPPGVAPQDSKGLYEERTAGPINLAEKSAQSSQPVWRLRLGALVKDATGNDVSKVVRFDKPGSSEKEVAGVFRKTGSAAGDAVIAADSYLVVMPEPKKPTGKDASTQVTVPVANDFGRFEINSGGVFKAERWPGAATYQSGADSIVFLERLEDPSKPWNGDPASAAYNPYVVLDRLGIKRVNKTGDGKNFKTFIRKDSVWNNGPFDTEGGDDVSGIVRLSPQAKSWMPWANRAYISHAELMLVPQGGGEWRYWDYDIPNRMRVKNLKRFYELRPYYHLPTPKLLDAAIVPSRFAGSQATVDPGLLGPVGMGGIPFNQLSRWREPGRVNLNTVVPNRSCADQRRDDAVWRAVVGADSPLSSDDYRNPESVADNRSPGQWPATSITEMLTLLQGDHVYVDTKLDDAEKVSRGKSWKKNRLYDENPAAAYTTAIRLANVATIRSHVFAVWVTIRVRDSAQGGKESYQRLFAVVDRSRPVGYSEGEDLNVADTIRVLRFLE